MEIILAQAESLLSLDLHAKETTNHRGLLLENAVIVSLERHARSWNDSGILLDRLGDGLLRQWVWDEGQIDRDWPGVGIGAHTCCYCVVESVLNSWALDDGGVSANSSCDGVVESILSRWTVGNLSPLDSSIGHIDLG